MSNEIIWEFSKGSLTAQKIEQVEEQLDIKFPKEYVEVVKKTTEHIRNRMFLISILVKKNLTI